MDHVQVSVHITCMVANDHDSWPLPAVLGSDFTAPSGTAMFSVGSMSGATDCITVTTIEDDNYESTHTFMTVIQTPTGPAMADASPCSVEITEDDGVFSI